MANKSKGFIKLYRSIQDNWLWRYNEPFDHRSAWVDILLMVNHKEDKFPMGDHVQIVKPGQKWTSYQSLGKRWGWSYRKVLRFMGQLTSDGMIHTDGTPKGTLLTVVNWEDFNGRGKADGIADGTTGDTSNSITPVITDGITDGIQTRSIRNIKNGKEIKERRFARDPVEDY